MAHNNHMCIRHCIKHKKAASETSEQVRMREVEKSAEEYVDAREGLNGDRFPSV